MNFRVPDLKKGDVMNAQGGQIVSILAILFLYTNVFTIIWNDGIKGQLISKGLFGILNSSKKRTKKFDLTIPQVYVGFLKEFEGTKKTFRN